MESVEERNIVGQFHNIQSGPSDLFMRNTNVISERKLVKFNYSAIFLRRKRLIHFSLSFFFFLFYFITKRLEESSRRSSSMGDFD